MPPHDVANNVLTKDEACQEERGWLFFNYVPRSVAGDTILRVTYYITTPDLAQPNLQIDYMPTKQASFVLLS